MPPTVTVLMPVLERTPFLREAVGSVLAQTFPDFELLVVDATPARLDAGADPDPRVRILTARSGAGLAEALDLGLASASGTLIARMGAEDVCLPERLAEQVELFARRPDLAVAGSAWHWIDEEGTVTAAEHAPPATDTVIRWQALLGPPFAPTSVMFRAAMGGGHEFASAVDESKVAPEYAFHSRLLAHGRAANLDSPLVRIRSRIGELEPPDVRMAHAAVARRNISALGLDLSSSDFARIHDLVVNTPARFGRDELESTPVLLELLAAFRRSPDVDRAEARVVAFHVADRVLWRALRSDARACWRTGAVKTALTGQPLWMVGAPGRLCADRATRALGHMQRSARHAQGHLETLPVRRPRALVRPGRYILLLSHMRSYSTLLAHILASNPEIGGHAELGLAYRFGFELVRSRSAVAPEEARRRFVLDKILHDEFVVRPAVLASERVHPIFLVRRAEPTIASILRMKDPSGPRPAWLRDPERVVAYYVGRLDTLKALAAATRGDSRAVFLSAERLVERPAQVTASLSRHLGLSQPLSTTYAIFEDTGVWGAGDTSERIRTGRVEPPGSEAGTGLTLPESLLARAREAYDDATATLAACCRELD